MAVGDFDCCKANEEDEKDVLGERSVREVGSPSGHWVGHGNLEI